MERTLGRVPLRASEVENGPVCLHNFILMEPPELEIADYELLLQVYRAWNPNLPIPAKEDPDAYQARIRETVRQTELKKEFLRVLKKLRKVIVG